jgi:hypothetical protein
MEDLLGKERKTKVIQKGNERDPPWQRARLIREKESQSHLDPRARTRHVRHNKRSGRETSSDCQWEATNQMKGQKRGKAQRRCPQRPGSGHQVSKETERRERVERKMGKRRGQQRPPTRKEQKPEGESGKGEGSGTRQRPRVNKHEQPQSRGKEERGGERRSQRGGHEANRQPPQSG